VIDEGADILRVDFRAEFPGNHVEQERLPLVAQLLALEEEDRHRPSEEEEVREGDL